MRNGERRFVDITAREHREIGQPIRLKTGDTCMTNDHTLAQRVEMVKEQETGNTERDASAARDLGETRNGDLHRSTSVVVTTQASIPSTLGAIWSLLIKTSYIS
jgi:hypothetical protein